MRRLTIIEYKPNQGPPGEQGPPGAGAELPIDSSDVLYAPTGQTVEEVLDELTYVDLLIQAFTTPQTVFEVGQSLTVLTLTWAFNKTITEQEITGDDVVEPTLLPATRAVNLALDNMTTDGTITLTAEDGSANPPVSAEINITFLSGVLFGSAPLPGAVDSTFLNTLGKSLQATRPKEFTVNLSTSVYGWYACPTSMGTPSFLVNGFSGGMTNVGTVAYTNSYGFTQDYTVWRTEFPSLGITLIEAQ